MGVARSVFCFAFLCPENGLNCFFGGVASPCTLGEEDLYRNAGQLLPSETYIYLNALLLQEPCAVGGVTDAYNVLDAMALEFLNNKQVEQGK